MAYLRTIMKGTLGGVEVWSTGITWGFFGIVADVADQAATDGILARLLAYSTTTNFPTDFKTLFSTGAVFTGWRVELRSEAERILSVSEGNMASAVPGTGSPSKTSQDALVISLRTSTPGARGRGRMYLPAVGPGLNANFTLSTPSSALVVAAAKTWLNAIGSQINLYYAGISSVITVVLSIRSVSSHVCRNVNLLQVGNILDTQRRRRDALLETYSAASYP